MARLKRRAIAKMSIIIHVLKSVLSVNFVPIKYSFFVIEMIVKPKKVEIVSTGQYLEALKTQQLHCKATGANPPAVVTWWMNNIQLTSTELLVSYFISMFIISHRKHLLGVMWFLSKPFPRMEEGVIFKFKLWAEWNVSSIWIEIENKFDKMAALGGCIDVVDLLHKVSSWIF